ncbi:hypothetical protein [Hymenobacter sp. YC55]|uniref:hypothetical protein n=1 Tax=Hymenobacter sp. YC55 TaxID=3034019 RepID=UPI0023F92A4A|nr:hypothetical protein [Hymenobacter sp. YC55]MDF7815183.1 hypothetical protein [Hymenobacter sp. YC55]
MVTHLNADPLAFYRLYSPDVGAGLLQDYLDTTRLLSCTRRDVGITCKGIAEFCAVVKAADDVAPLALVPLMTRSASI